MVWMLEGSCVGSYFSIKKVVLGHVLIVHHRCTRLTKNNQKRLITIDDDHSSGLDKLSREFCSLIIHHYLSQGPAGVFFFHSSSGAMMAKATAKVGVYTAYRLPPPEWYQVRALLIVLVPASDTINNTNGFNMPTSYQ